MRTGSRTLRRLPSASGRGTSRLFLPGTCDTRTIRRTRARRAASSLTTEDVDRYERREDGAARSVANLPKRRP